MGNNTDKRVEFYDKLRNSPSGTMEINGMVLGHETNSNWHVCKSGDNGRFNVDVRNACSHSGPNDPFYQPNYSNSDGDSISRQSFKRETELLAPREYIEKGSLCSHCERMVTNKFDIDRVVMSVSEELNEDIDRFIARRKNALEDS